MTWDGAQWVCNKSCVEDSECDSDTVCNAGSCVPQITSSGLCETDADCTSPLVCHTGSGLCECQTDVVWQARMSWSCPEVGATTVSPPVTTPINGPCTRDEHCPGVSTCDNNPGVCVCLHTVQLINGEYVCTTPCSTDGECSTLNPSAVCEAGLCVDNQDPINTPIPFVPYPDYDGSCTTDNDCMSMNVCQAGMCTCQESLIAVGGDVICSTVCAEDANCPDKYVCNQGVCVEQILSNGCLLYTSDAADE